ncbi:hypothetical protein INS49_004627 [Diaporthe citri]|uniref:uncharacterized protein n=1 Tax=Diaporthe citri TaxID=83186 RepID=UPI001C7F1568|nr:uncharacterized protein INS49_004627 [Diaporthe citri]KAG6354609.1 hypothetical protein INS49_004627 [Diaporthe citri]
MSGLSIGPGLEGTNADNEEAASNASDASTGQADGHKDFAFQYYPIDDAESLEKYRVGGYHLIAIGDTLKDGRYQIVDKLRHGGYSTIWIGRDRDAAAQLLHSDDDRASMILPILDEFVLDGPNGQHSCIVTPPARMSIAASKSGEHNHNIFPIPTARAVAAQLAQAVAFCHAQGVVHGDLHTGNVLLRFAPADDIHALSQSAFYERFGARCQEPVKPIDGEGVGGSGSLFGPGFFPSDDNLRKGWVHAIGRLPDEWWEFLFTEDGLVRDDRRDHFISCNSGLEGRFELLVQGPGREEDMQEFLDDEKSALLKMLRAMLAYKPADRINAQDVLCTEWMLRWGLPAVAKLKKLG